MRHDRFHVLVKPTCDCNLSCTYCYDKPMREKYHGIRLTLDKVEHLAKLVSDLAVNCDWLWHGGEPTIVNLDWYTEVNNIFNKYHTTNFRQNIQTNGIIPMKNPDWLDFLADNSFSIGVSFDIFTQNTRQPGNIEEIMKDHTELHKSILDSGIVEAVYIISVVTVDNIHRLTEMYDYLKSVMVDYKFIMCLSYVTEHTSENNNLEINHVDFKPYILNFYKHILFDTDYNASYSSDLLIILDAVMHMRSKCDCYNTECRKSRIGLHPSGEVSYCDTMFSKFNLGNITDYTSILDIFETDEYKRLSEHIEERYINECYKCDYFEMCGGWCHHEHMKPDGTFNTCNKNVCIEVSGRIDSMYDCISSIQKGDSLNPIILEILTNHKTLLPCELEHFFKQVGVTVKLHSPTIVSNEYKIFKYFTTADWCEHSELFSLNRFEYFKAIYTKNKEQLDILIEEVNNG